ANGRERARARGDWARGALLGALAASLSAAAMAQTAAPEPTRGVGIYPGDPAQDFAPTLVVDSSTYRNLALHRAAYQSSAYDYNLTAQLVTDGIVETTPPRWLGVSLSTNGGQPTPEGESLG